MIYGETVSSRILNFKDRLKFIAVILCLLAVLSGIYFRRIKASGVELQSYLSSAFFFFRHFPGHQ